MDERPERHRHADLKTYNRLLGGQVGMRVAHTWARRPASSGQNGLYFNDASSETIVNDPGTATAFTRKPEVRTKLSSANWN